VTGTAHLRCEAIAKSFGARTVLRDVDVEVAEGTLTAILGSSGSGKTTLLRVIIGFIAPDAGTVTIAGSIVAGGGRKPVAPDKRAVGYVAQEGALYPHLSVGENIGFGLPRGERKRGGRVVEMLELVGLGSDYAERRPHELSGGEQRRVALARALAPRPRLVLLDEPFSGLDDDGRAWLAAQVAERVEAGATVLLTDHSGSAAGRVALTDVLRLHDGAVQRSAALRAGTPRIGAGAGGAGANAVTIRATHPDGRAFERTLAATASDDVLRALLDAGWHVEEVRR